MKRIIKWMAVAVGVIAGAPAQAATTDPTSFMIPQAQAAFAAGAITAESLTRAFLARIEKYEPAYNAFVVMNPSALGDARAIDRRRAAGEKLGPLAGIPVVVKDSINMAGLPTTAGWSGLTASAGGITLIPERDAPVVQRLRAAGAIILGKTNLPAFAVSGDNANDSAHGPTLNVLNRDWTPGGSSTGTAAAVAAGFAIAGVAEETGGSIQNPAAAQGLVGIKPTFALVPTSGGVPQAATTRDVLGPITKTVEDAAIMLDVLAGYTLEDPQTNAAVGNMPAAGYAASSKPLKGARIGLYGPGWRTADGEMTPETSDLYRRAVKTLTSKGAIVVEDPFAGSGFAALAQPKNGFDPRGSEALPYELDQYLRHLGDTAAVHSLAELQQKTGVDLFAPKAPLNYFARTLPALATALANPTVPPDMTEFTGVRTAYIRAFNAVMTKHNLDALFFPQQTAPIGKIYGGHVAATTVSEINIAGLPGVILPAGKYAGGQPFAVIFVGAMWSEAALIGYARDLESGLPPRLVNTNLETAPFKRP